MYFGDYMFYTEINESAKTGTKRLVDGIAYIKQINGKWKIHPTPVFKSWLKNLYVSKGLTLRQLHIETGIPHSSLQTLINELGLMRSKKEKASSHIDIVTRERDNIRKWNLKAISSGKIARKLAAKYNVDMCNWAFLQACKRIDLPFYKLKDLQQLYLDANFEKLKSRYLDDKVSCLELSRRIAKNYSHLNITTCRLKTYFQSRKVSVRNQEEARVFYSDKILAAGRTSKGILSNIRNKQSWYFKFTLDVNSLTYNEYKTLVSTVTRSARSRYPDHYQHIAYHEDKNVDHIFSIHDGYFKLNEETLEFERRKKIIPLWLIAHPLNLQMLPTRTNRIKGSNSWITLKQLIQSVRESGFQLTKETLT